MRQRIDRWDARVNGLAMWVGWTTRTRTAVLRRLGVGIGDFTLVQPCTIGSRRVTIGTASYIGPGCLLDGTDAIRIGDRVGLGPGVMLLTGSHDASDPALRAGEHRNGPVVVEDGAWIGARAVVLPGVTIGTGCVIAAGAVVTSDCAPHGLYAGVPATRRKDLSTEPVAP